TPNQSDEDREAARLRTVRGVARRLDRDPGAVLLSPMLLWRPLNPPYQRAELRRNPLHRQLEAPPRVVESAAVPNLEVEHWHFDSSAYQIVSPSTSARPGRPTSSEQRAVGGGVSLPPRRAEPPEQEVVAADPVVIRRSQDSVRHGDGGEATVAQVIPAPHRAADARQHGELDVGQVNGSEQNSVDRREREGRRSGNEGAKSPEQIELEEHLLERRRRREENERAEHRGLEEGAGTAGPAPDDREEQRDG